MRTLYFDCFSGASGDMLLGALVDAGASFETVASELSKLGLTDVELVRSRVDRSGIAATKIDVVVGGRVEGVHGAIVEHGHHHHRSHEHPHDHPHDAPEGGHRAAHADAATAATGAQSSSARTLAQILALIAASELADTVKARATSIFKRLGEAEARVHGSTLDDVHFHEVGAADAIADVVGTCIALESLGVERFVCSPMNVGGGTVTFSHGTYPVPTPATAELVKGALFYSGAPQKELLTPTGAAILTSVANAYGSLPEMNVAHIGYGAGTRDVPGYPNVLRVFVGECQDDSSATDRVTVIDAAIDDMTAEELGFFAERALVEGALDVFFTPIQMKKNRPGTQVTLVAKPEDFARVSDLVFRETTTIGFRYRESMRRVLDRSTVTVSTHVGSIRVKIARMGGVVVNSAPEYDDCREAALRTGLSLHEVQALALRAFAEEER